MNPITMDESPKSRLRQIAHLAEIYRSIETKDPNDFQLFVDTLRNNHPDLEARVPALNKEQYSHTLHLIHMAWRWRQFGMPIYQLTHSLAAALMLTEPPKMAEGEELELPHPAFGILVPPELIPVFGPNGEQKWADMIWVQRFDGMHVGSGEKKPFIRWTTESGGIAVWRDRNPKDLYVEDERVYVLFPDHEVAPQDDDEITMGGALRLLRNFCSWAAATGELEKAAAAKPRKSSKAKKSKKAKPPKARVMQVGQSVKLATELRHMATEISLGTSRHAREGWQLRTKHVVSGHWKNQAYGEKRAYRRRIWVEPYWRGPEGDKAWNELITKEAQ